MKSLEELEQTYYHYIENLRNDPFNSSYKL